MRCDYALNVLDFLLLLVKFYALCIRLELEVIFFVFVQESSEEKPEGENNDFWEFKVPQPPKPKMEVNRAEKWSESIEKLLADPCGLDIFTVRKK